MTAPYPLRERLWLGAALMHLVLMALGATTLGYGWMGKKAARVADYYGTATGASDSYPFFAPGINGQLRAFFDVIDAKGQTRTVTLENGSSAEADLRVGDIVGQFEDMDPTDKNLPRALSASLASTIFSRYPGTARVAVRLEHYKPVSMGDYRAGQRPAWSPLYQATFEIRRHAGLSVPSPGDDSSDGDDEDDGEGA